MYPPDPSWVTVLGCSPVRIKPQVRHVRTVFILLPPCWGGIEARPAVEHQRAPSGVHVDSGAELNIIYYGRYCVVLNACWVWMKSIYNLKILFEFVVIMLHLKSHWEKLKSNKSQIKNERLKQEKGKQYQCHCWLLSNIMWLETNIVL